MTNLKIIGFFILEFVAGVAVGLFGLFIFNEKLLKYDLDLSILLSLTTIYLFSVIGISISGYFYLKFYGNTPVYISAVCSAIVWTLFAIFLYIFSAFFLNWEILASREMAIGFPIFFGVIGFNTFALNRK